MTTTTASYSAPEWLPGTPTMVRFAPKVESFLGCGCLIVLVALVGGFFLALAGGSTGWLIVAGAAAAALILSWVSKVAKRDYKKYRIPQSELLVMDRRAWNALQRVSELPLGAGELLAADAAQNEVRELFYEGAALEIAHKFSPKILQVNTSNVSTWLDDWQEIAHDMAIQVMALEDLTAPL